MNIPPELWPEVSRLLDEALNLSAAQRLDWLARLAATQPQLAVQLQRLLQAHDRPAGADPLNGPPAQLLVAALSDHPAAQANGLAAGQMLGPYRLLASIGEGGMASVWLAEQTVNVLRRVALKIPHARLEEPAITAARFIQERDLLASLEHPHIARLYDANISADPRPYLAIEWIDGVPITRYADEHRLSIAQRVELFQQVLQAVRFAHARLVIHRDVKPSNILVTAGGDVKLLDFGISALLDDARADSAHEGSSAGVTRALTPETASPEQLAGEPLGTPSDVYSLGIVLYELLTGRRPYRLHTPDGDNSVTALHEALLGTPVTPLSRAPLDGAAAAARGTSVRGLRRALSGDLEAICHKALRKRATDRYDSAEAMSTDLARWRMRLPVDARRAHPAYVISRFISRNRLAVIAGATVTLALCVGLGLALWQAQRARQEARLAQSVQEFLSSLFDANDPQQAQGRDVSAKELLARGAQRLDTGLQNQPVVLARLQHEIGGLYVQLGDNVAARPRLERSLQLYQQVGKSGSEDAIDASFELTEALDEEMQTDAARKVGERTLALADANFGPHNRWRLPVRTELAWMILDDHPQAAADMIKQALDEAWQNDPHVYKQTLKSRSELGTAYLELGQLERARDTFAQVVRDAPAIADYELTDLLVDRFNLARARYNLRDFAQATVELTALVPAMDRHLGAGHDRTIKTRSLWAQSLAEQGRYQQAVEIERQNLRNAQSRPSVDAEVVSLQKITLAKLLKMSFLPAEGLPLALEGEAFLDAKHPEPFWNREIGRRLLGELLLQDGQLDAALSQFETAATNAKQLDDYAHNMLYAEILQVQAMGLRLRAGSGDAQRSVTLLSEALAIFSSALGAANPATLRCATQLAWLRALQAPTDAAMTARFEQATTAFAATLPREHVGHAELLLMKAELSLRAGASAKGREQLQAGKDAWRASMDGEFRAPFTFLH
jgi:serine/threonine protein kinase